MQLFNLAGRILSWQIDFCRFAIKLFSTLTLVSRDFLKYIDFDKASLQLNYFNTFSENNISFITYP